jgi:hypothetical protein
VAVDFLERSMVILGNDGRPIEGGDLDIKGGSISHDDESNSNHSFSMDDLVHDNESNNNNGNYMPHFNVLQQLYDFSERRNGKYEQSRQ